MMPEYVRDYATFDLEYVARGVIEKKLKPELEHGGTEPRGKMILYEWWIDMAKQVLVVGYTLETTDEPH